MGGSPAVGLVPAVGLGTMTAGLIVGLIAATGGLGSLTSIEVAAVTSASGVLGLGTVATGGLSVATAGLVVATVGLGAVGFKENMA